MNILTIQDGQVQLSNGASPLMAMLPTRTKLTIAREPQGCSLPQHSPSSPEAVLFFQSKACHHQTSIRLHLPHQRCKGAYAEGRPVKTTQYQLQQRTSSRSCACHSIAQSVVPLPDSLSLQLTYIRPVRSRSAVSSSIHLPGSVTGHFSQPASAGVTQ